MVPVKIQTYRIFGWGAGGQRDNSFNPCRPAPVAIVKSRFIEMFGDPRKGYKCRIDKLGNVSFVGSSKRVFKEEITSEGIPFLRGTEVSALSNGEHIVPELHIAEEHYKQLVDATGKPEIGDLLMPSICPDGQIWYVNAESPFYFKDGRVLWVKPNRCVLDGLFLKYALGTIFKMDFANIASGTTFAELKIFILKKLEIPVPPLALQQEFAAFVTQVDKLRFAAC